MDRNKTCIKYFPRFSPKVHLFLTYGHFLQNTNFLILSFVRDMKCLRNDGTNYWPNKVKFWLIFRKKKQMKKILFHIFFSASVLYRVIQNWDPPSRAKIWWDYKNDQCIFKHNLFKNYLERFHFLNLLFTSHWVVY